MKKLLSFKNAHLLSTTEQKMVTGGYEVECHRFGDGLPCPEGMHCNFRSVCVSNGIGIAP